MAEARTPTSVRSLDRPAYRALPDRVTVRECRVRAARSGFRARSVVAATTLVDPRQATPDDLAGLDRAIDLVYRRSTDGGTTWTEAKKVVDIGGGFEKNPAAVNQKLGRFPVITVNPVAMPGQGVVHFLYCVKYRRCSYTRGGTGTSS